MSTRHLTQARDGSSLLRRLQRWWNDSRYLEDVALVFTTITVVNSVMMLADWDTPKSGTFTYTHLLSRLAIVAVIVALFHLDDFSMELSLRGALEKVTVAFTIVTGVLCLTAIVSSVWWEPRGGEALYGALLVLAAALTVLVGGSTWFRNGAS